MINEPVNFGALAVAAQTMMKEMAIDLVQHARTLEAGYASTDMRIVSLVSAATMLHAATPNELDLAAHLRRQADIVEAAAKKSRRQPK